MNDLWFRAQVLWFRQLDCGFMLGWLSSQRRRLVGLCEQWGNTEYDGFNIARVKANRAERNIIVTAANSHERNKRFVHLKVQKSQLSCTDTTTYIFKICR